MRTRWLAVSLALGSTFGTACGQHRSEPRDVPKREEEPAAAAPLPKASLDLPPVDVQPDLAWLAVGGGSDPASNQVSLAQDIAAFQRIARGRGLTLFASGPSAQLAVLDGSVRNGELGLDQELAELFGPKGAIYTRYEGVRIPVDGPASAENVLSTLRRALAPRAEPLWLYVAAHGEQGERPSANVVSLWGGFSVSAQDLAGLLDQEPARRPLRFVMTSCFGGGFADAIFHGANEAKGLRSSDHCGLFAAPWDDEASGCDPNPDRRAQESYAIHLLHALEGRDRKGRERSSEIDLDHDSKIGLLEAHTWARIHAASFDVPTTTSERYLRSQVRAQEASEASGTTSPEEAAVIGALGNELELSSEADARAKLQELDRVLADLESSMQEAQRAEDDTYYALRVTLLERWPLLDHPWERRTQRLLAKEGKEILRVLRESDMALAHREAARELDELALSHDTARLARAKVARLVRAFETARLERALIKRGGQPWKDYEALRACERWVPSTTR